MKISSRSVALAASLSSASAGSVVPWSNLCGWRPTIEFARIIRPPPYTATFASVSSLALAARSQRPTPTSSRSLRRQRNCAAPFSMQSRALGVMEGSQKADVAAKKEDSSLSVPLVDADCNLIHPDLVALGLAPLGNTDEEGPRAAEQLPELEILKHPSTAAANIRAVVSPAGTLDEGDRALQIIAALPGARLDLSVGGDQDGTPQHAIQIRTTVGIHPYHAQSLDDGHKEQIRERMIATLESPHFQQGRVACVGECGLDYSDGFPPREDQLANFRIQLELAFRYRARLFLHERSAFDDTLLCIDEAAAAATTTVPILVHCFTGSYDECLAYINRGYYISLAGFIFKEGAEGIRRALREGVIPLDRLMVETDAPYLGFANCRDELFQNQPGFEGLTRKKQKRLLKSTYPNPPSALPLIVEAIAEELNAGRLERGEELLDVASVATATSKTAVNFFGFESFF